VVQNCLTPATPYRSTRVQTHGWCHSVGNQMIEVTKSINLIEIGDRNAKNIKTVVKNAILCGKICDVRT